MLPLITVEDGEIRPLLLKVSHSIMLKSFACICVIAIACAGFVGLPFSNPVRINRDLSRALIVSTD